MQYKRIVLNEPHASVEGLYDDELSFWQIDARFINDVVMRLTDWHTDYLFHGYRNERIRAVRFPYSRFVVDAERLWNDPMETIGQGIVYRYYDKYVRSVPKDAEKRLLRLWHWHQQQLRNALSEDALLLDCHSFPSEMGDVDICIGFNEDWSKPAKDTLELAVNLFEENGYKVGFNEPFSNSETPDCPFRYQSMMIEVNKRTYMDPNSLHLKCPTHFKQDVNGVITHLMQFVCRLP
jgi:N-formylglutamate amidohydrolase